MTKQFLRAILCSWTVMLVFQAVNAPAFAQLPPPISPWMGMFDRREPGTLDNYHRVVKPRQDALKAYAAQASQIQSQQQALQALQSGGTGARDLSGGVGAPAGNDMLLSAPRELPTTQRNPAGFNQYLHYYPSNSLTRRPVPNFSPVGRRW